MPSDPRNLNTTEDEFQNSEIRDEVKAGAKADVEDVDTSNGMYRVRDNGYCDFGDPTYVCVHCGALLWYGERALQSKETKNPQFSICCMQGKIKLPDVQQPPDLLMDLLSGNHLKSRHFKVNIRSYNMMFSFTSMGGKFDTKVNQGQGPYCFCLVGNNIHRIGSLMPQESSRPKFCQLYMYDTDQEINNIKDAISVRFRSQFDDSLIDQYPLIFSYGEDGEDGRRLRIGHRRASLAQIKKNNPNQRNTVTFREWFAYRIQERASEHSAFLRAGRLMQQPLVDGYTMYEAQRLNYIRNNQSKLRYENYKNLANAVAQGEVSPSSSGGRIVIPSSFGPGQSFFRESYQDTMVICKWTGYPDLFITFTCNRTWPEIVRFVRERGLKTEDRPDIMSRMFKIKLDELIWDVKSRSMFGRTRAVVYTIEFQKHGLPYVHIILFLQPKDKYSTIDEIDNIISAEIPDPVQNPHLHEAVMEFMLGLVSSTGSANTC